MKGFVTTKRGDVHHRHLTFYGKSAKIGSVKNESSVCSVDLFLCCSSAANDTRTLPWKKKTYHLGTYADLQNEVQARQEAEKVLLQEPDPAKADRTLSTGAEAFGIVVSHRMTDQILIFK